MVALVDLQNCTKPIHTSLLVYLLFCLLWFQKEAKKSHSPSLEWISRFDSDYAPYYLGGQIGK